MVGVSFVGFVFISLHDDPVRIMSLIERKQAITYTASEMCGIFIGISN